MISIYSSAYDGIRVVLDTYIRLVGGIKPRDIISLLPTCSVALLAYLQWRVNLENSRRYFSEKLLEYFGPIQAAQGLAFKMLSAQKNYDNNLKLNRFSDGHEQTLFMVKQKKRIKKYSDELGRALGPAYDSMFKLSLFLGLHRPETPTSSRRYAKTVHDKTCELLLFAQQCKAEIIEHDAFEVSGKKIDPIIGMQPDEAQDRLRRLRDELINLLTSRYKVSNL